MLVLHPSAMEPCIDQQTHVYVRNIFNPGFEGTIITGRCASLKDSFENKIMNWRSKSGFVPIKGITSVNKVALVTLEGASIGGANVAERFMGAMADNNINVLIITQASSESSITVAVPENEGQRALASLENVFELELSRSKINSLSVATGMSIVAIVGEGMAYTTGVSSTFMVRSWRLFYPITNPLIRIFSHNSISLLRPELSFQRQCQHQTDCSRIFGTTNCSGCICR